jgi:uncharacterized pyridoxamine 5'-phosphate oxidase family protein
MNKAVEYLKDSKVFFIATVEDDQPRVRPFGAVMEHNGKVYICTNNKKECFKQMKANPRVEIAAMGENGSWIRITGEVACDPDRNARAAMLEACPSLKAMYSPDDGLYEVLYFTSGTVNINAKPPVTFEL